jgi:AhpC/TSA family
MCHLQEFHKKYKDKGLVILGFDCADDKQIALEMLRENNATFTNIIDSTEAAQKVCFNDYQTKGASAVPMSYIIDRDGNVVDAWYGYYPDQSKALAAFQKSGGVLAETIRQEASKKTENVAAAERWLFEAIRTADYVYNAFLIIIFSFAW